MVSQPPKDTPFGLEPNVAAGLAYLLGIIGGIIMLVGGGTNKFVRFAAAQSITMWGLYFVFYVAVMIVNIMLSMVHLWMLIPLVGIVSLLVGLLYFVLWIYTFVMGFQGKDVQLPVISDLTRKFFATQI